MIETWIAVWMFIVGLAIGGFIMTLVVTHMTIHAGDFVITYDDPEKDLIRIDLSVDLPEIEKSKRIYFTVVKERKKGECQISLSEQRRP